MKDFLIIIMNTETLELYPVQRTALTPRQAIKLVKLSENEKVDSIYVEITDY